MYLVTQTALIQLNSLILLIMVCRNSLFITNAFLFILSIYKFLYLLFIFI